MKVGILFVSLGLLWSQAEGACYSSDPSWDARQGPKVTQPSKSDATKVMLEWSSIIKNEGCVDKYTVLVWPKGKPKESGRRLLAGRTTVSFIVEVEACVEYSFAIELYEDKSPWPPFIRESALANFKTEAIPQLKSRDKNLFTVGYYFNPAKGMHDLSRVSIKFPKKILDNPNCIKQVEAKGNLDQNPHHQPGVTSGAREAAPSVVDHLQNATLMWGAAQLYPNHYHERGWHGRPGFLPVQAPAQAGKKRTKRFSWGKKTTTTPRPVTSRPPIQLTGTSTPPYMGDSVEVVIDGVEACQPFIFSIKIVSPRGTVMGEIDGLKLPPLNEILDYHPPSLTELFQIDVLSAGQPVIRWQQGVGVPAACLPTFFDAVDIHIRRLEDEIIFHVNEEYQTDLHEKHFEKELVSSQSSTLTKYGCKCNSTKVKLSSTDPTTLKKIPHLLGVYHYDADLHGKPFYRMPSKHADREPDFLIPPNSDPVTQPHHRGRRFIGKIPGSPTGASTPSPYDSPPAYPPPPTPSPTSYPTAMWSVPTTTKKTTAKWYFPTPAPTLRPNPTTQRSPVTQPPPPISTPMRVAFFLYYEPTEKSWVMSNFKGGPTPWIKSQKNSPFVCPADPGNVKTWSYEDPVTKKWVSDVTMKFECAPNA